MLIESAQQLELESKLFKGFADKSRLAILETILEGPKTVSEIAKKTKLSQPNTSMHLACLLECNLVRKEKKGREVLYRIATKEIKSVIQAARKILKAHAKEIYECTHY